MFNNMHEFVSSNAAKIDDIKIVDTAWCPVIQFTIEDKTYWFTSTGRTCDNPMMPREYIYREESPYPKMPSEAREIHNKFRQTSSFEHIPAVDAAWIKLLTKKLLGSQIFGG